MGLTRCYKTDVFFTFIINIGQAWFRPIWSSFVHPPQRTQHCDI